MNFGNPTTAGVLLISAGLFGCGSETAPSDGQSSSPDSGDWQEADAGDLAVQDEIEVELFPSTIQLDAGALDRLMSEDPDGTLHFEGTPDALADVERFQVLISGANPVVPNGMLRLVTSVEESDEGLVLETMRAPLQLAFSKLHVRMQRTQTLDPQTAWDGQGRRVFAGGQGTQTHDIELPPIDGDNDPDSGDDQVQGSGTISGSFDYVLGLDVDWGDVFNLPQKVADCLDDAIFGGGCSPTDLLPELTVGYEVTADASAELNLEGVSYLPSSAPYEFEPIDLGYFFIGPLLFHPTVELGANIEAEATSQFALSSYASAGFHAGVSFSTEDGASDLEPELWHDFEAPVADATLFAESRIELRPRLRLWLYDIMGPSAGLTPWVALSANHEQDPCWRLTAGVDAEMGIAIRVDIPGFDDLIPFKGWDTSFAVVDETEIDSGDCPELEGSDAEPLPIAGAPSEDAFVNPNFEPWSRSYAGAVVNHPYEWPGAQVEWTQLTPTFDGRFLMTGSNMDTLLKIDTQGEVIWARRYEPPEPFNETVLVENLLPSVVVNTPDGAPLLVAHPWTLLKIEPGGNPLWVRHFDQPHSEEVYRITAASAAPDAGFFLLGNTGEDVNIKVESDVVLARTSSIGEVVWSQRFGSGTMGERGTQLVPFEDGVVALGSTWDPEESRWRAFVMYLDADANVIWSKRLRALTCDGSGEAYSGQLMTGLVAKDGDLVLAGMLGIAPNATLVLKLKPDGSLGWSASEQAPDPHLGPMINALVELPTSGYLAAGTFNHWDPGSIEYDDVWLGALDGVGRLQWMKAFGGERVADDLTYRDDAYPGLALTQDGGALVASYTDTLTEGGRGMWAFKVPAKNAELSFNGEDVTHTEDLEWLTDERFCLELEDYPLASEQYPLVPESLAVKVNVVNVDTSSQAP